MLIRSQDKKSIMNLDNIMRINVIVPPMCITERMIMANGAELGTYSTEEKAIKVLDKIQEEYLKCNCQPIMGNYGFVRNSIFQMPQDGDVAND